MNEVKAGQAIPLIWRLTDASGAAVTKLHGAQISVASIPCSSGSTLDKLEEVAAGDSGVQNLGNGYYRLNWKSPSSYTNSCKRLRLDLSEGNATTMPANWKAGRRRYFAINWIQLATSWSAFVLYLVALASL